MPRQDLAFPRRTAPPMWISLQRLATAHPILSCNISKSGVWFNIVPTKSLRPPKLLASRVRSSLQSRAESRVGLLRVFFSVSPLSVTTSLLKSLRDSRTLQRVPYGFGARMLWFPVSVASEFSFGDGDITALSLGRCIGNIYINSSNFDICLSLPLCIGVLAFSSR